MAQAYHITNTSDSLPCISRETLNHQLISAENIYNQVATIKTENDIERDVLLQALNGMDYKRFITRDGKRNHFMWDNAWEDEKISGYYQSPSALEAAYADAPFHTKIYHYKAPVTDEDRLRRQSGRLNAKELWQEVTAQLTKLTEDKPEAEASYLMEELGDEFCVMVKAFMQLGAERIETLGYDRRKIEAALGCDAENRLLTSEKMQQAVYGRFHTDDIVPANEVNTFMRQLINDNGIPFNSRVDRKIIGLFFELEDCKQGGARAFKFGRRKFDF